MTNPGHYTAVILAAGRGSRLGSLTDERPKCLMELSGRALLDWQISALSKAGVPLVYAVTGYRREMIEAQGVKTVFNKEWENTNMVASLLCAFEHLHPPFLVSYSDIVFDSGLVKRLLSATADLALSYDTEWLDLWKQRFDDPLKDAETFRIDDDGTILEIGGKTDDVQNIQGQFMGLMKFSRTAVQWVFDLTSAEPGLRFSLDSTGLIMRLIRLGKAVKGVSTSGGWCEIDSPKDLSVAQKLLQNSRLSLPG